MRILAAGPISAIAQLEVLARSEPIWIFQEKVDNSIVVLHVLELFLCETIKKLLLARLQLIEARRLRKVILLNIALQDIVNVVDFGIIFMFLLHWWVHSSCLHHGPLGEKLLRYEFHAWIHTIHARGCLSIVGLSRVA